jgi:hypothetical protein
MGRLLATLGLVLLAAGLLLIALERFGITPGRLPGDLLWRGRHTTVFFPLGTCLLLSLVLSLLMYLVSRLRH